MHPTLKRYALIFAAWLPFFAIWLFLARYYAHLPLPAAIYSSLASMGSASLLGIVVWHVCRRVPWPLNLDFRFYLIQIFFALVYTFTWLIADYSLDALRRGTNPFTELFRSPLIGWQILTGIWIYGIFAGVSYAVQTRGRMHEKEMLAARAESLASAARLDAIRARLNPHFLFNALHTLAALVKFRPELAEGAVERLGDMLRYTLKDDNRELVEFSEEYEFTRQYIAFEQLRFGDRLAVDLKFDPEAAHFDVPPFSIQALAENAVHHAIAIRPEGGAIWISCAVKEGTLEVIVRDNGPGSEATRIDASQSGGSASPNASHQFGLRALRERLIAAFGPSASLNLYSGSAGFTASFRVPASPDSNRASANSASAPQ